MEPSLINPIIKAIKKRGEKEESTCLGVVLGSDIKGEIINNIIGTLLDKIEKFPLVVVSLGGEQLKEFVMKEIEKEKEEEEKKNVFETINKRNYRIKFFGWDYNIEKEIREKIIEIEKESINNDAGFLFVFVDYAINKDCFKVITSFISEANLSSNWKWKDIDIEKMKEEVAGRMLSSELLYFDILVFIGKRFNSFPPMLKNTKIIVIEEEKSAIEKLKKI